MIDQIIKNALNEDIGDGDHSSLSCVPENAMGTAKLIVKQEGIIAGVDLAERIFKTYDSSLEITTYIQDGQKVKPQQLDPMERARRNPTSLRAAINAKCFDCCGNQRIEVTLCEMVECPLWNLRPWQRK